jgi:hypothetical protein
VCEEDGVDTDREGEHYQEPRKQKEKQEERCEDRPEEPVSWLHARLQAYGSPRFSSEVFSRKAVPVYPQSVQ